MIPAERPAVSVVVPFAGTAAEARSMVEQLTGLRLRLGDEVIVADNSRDGVVVAGEAVVVVRAERVGSSYYARNTGAEVAARDWIVFVDSDCLLPPTLLDDYFAPAPAEGTGIVAGGIEGDPEQESLVARYHRSRGHLHADKPLETGPSPAGGTANLLVRRAAWEQVGGFHEVVSGADFEFSWRAGELGWGVEHRPLARVRHRHPNDVATMRRKARRYGAGQLWVERRYPGAPRRPGLARELARAVAGVVVWSLTARFERAAFKGLDGIWIAAYARGWWSGDNRARSLAQGGADDAGPVVVAPARPLAPGRGHTARVETIYLEDSPPLERLTATIRLVVRHPLRCRRDRRGTAPGEPGLPALAPAAIVLAREPRRAVTAAADARLASRLEALGAAVAAD